jgi:hypothetical protein
MFIVIPKEFDIAYVIDGIRLAYLISSFTVANWAIILSEIYLYAYIE